MAPTLRGTPTSSGQANAPTATATKPTGLAVGDLLLAFHESDSDGTLAAMTQPSGFTTLGTPQAGNSTTNIPPFKVWYKIATSTDVAASSFAFPDSSGANCSLILMAFQAGTFDATTPVSVTTYNSQGNAPNASIGPAPNITGTSGALLLCGYAIDSGGTLRSYSGTPSGMTLVHESTAGGATYTRIAVYSQTLASGGAIGTKTATLSATPNGWATVSLLVNPAATASAPTVGAGTDVTGHLVSTALSRTATENDNGSAITSRAWTIQSGPAGVGTTIGTAAALSWTPTVTGTYVLRYSATNSIGTGTDDVTVTVATLVVREVVSGSNYAGTSSSITVNTTQAQVGDLLVLVCGTDYTPSTPIDHAAPTGTGGSWTRRTPTPTLSNNDANCSIWTRPVTQTTNSATFTSNGNDAGAYAHLYVIAGHDTSSPVDGAATTVVPTAAGTSWAAPSVTGSSGGLLICGWQTQFQQLTAPTLPGSMTDPITTSNASAQGVMRTGREILASSGATGTRTATGPNDRYATASIAIRPAPAVAAPTVGAGTDVTGHLVSTEFTRTATENANGSTITSRAWTIQAGPAGVGTTIGTAAALSWTPSTAGTYTLRYAATNSLGTGTDDMTIQVIAPSAPTVSAGADVASHDLGTQFSRTATENANGSTITSRAWTIESGPGIGSDEPHGITPIFSTSFETGDFTEFSSCQWTGRNDNCSTYDGASDYSATVVAIDGRPDVFRCEVRNGDVPPFGGGERSEIAEAPGAVVFDGDEVWFAVDIKFPSDFPTISDWMIVSQLHPTGDLSPTVTLQLLGSDNILYLTNDEPTSDPVNIEIGPIVKGSWVRYIVHFMAGTSTADGWAEVYQDGSLVVSQTPMATVADTSEHYWKWGTYRSAAETVTTVVYEDNIRITHGTQAAGGGSGGEVIGTAATLNWTPSVAGAYVLQYAATNAIGTGTDQMSITVTSGPPPTVGAGADVSDWLVETEFTRTATESGSGITAREWKILTGPFNEGMVLGTAAALSWIPTFPGTYVLRYSATNAGGTDTDDMSIEVILPPATPGEILNIGIGSGRNHFSVDIARPTERELIECEQIEAGYEEEPYFTGTSDYSRCAFWTSVDAATTSGSSYPRSELREVNPGGSVNAAWDPHDGGTHWIRGRSAATHLMAVKPTLIMAQQHSGDDDVIQIRSRLVGGSINLEAVLNGGTSGTIVLLDPFVTDVEFDWMLEILPPINGQTALGRIYYQSWLEPVHQWPVTDMPVTTPGHYYKAGNYLNSNTETENGNSSEFGSSTLRNLQHWHTGWAAPDNGFWGLPDVDAGADASTPSGWTFTRTGIDGATAAQRVWYVVDGPAASSDVGTYVSDSATLSWAPTVQGDYRLRYGVTVTDIGTNFDDILVTVTAPVSAGGGFLPFFGA